MKRLTILANTVLLCSSLLFVATNGQAQCKTWQESDMQETAEEQHVLYRSFIKNEEYEKAFPHWQKAYEIAPAADGERPFHFSDGRKIYMDMFKKATDEEKKKEYAQMILDLYDQEIQCYGKDGQEAFLLGRKAYDMFYYLNSPYSKQLETLKAAVEKGGNKTEYIVFDPYARVVVYEYEKERMSAEEARNIYLRLNEIADHNIENNQQYGEYYNQAKATMNGTFAAIEYDIFDCEYFKNKYEPAFREKPDDFEMVKQMFNRLKAQGCDEADPFVAELKQAYETTVAEINAAKLQEFYAENPGAHAKALYDEGKYQEAIDKYKEAIEKEEKNPEGADNEKLATYNFSISSILFRKMNSYSSARDYAYRAAKLKPGWGQPYMAIGDMYASTSSSCGSDSFSKQVAILAAIDKYAYAKSIDSEVADEANSKISKYSDFRPDKQEAFMRGYKEGQKMNTGCWIGETVTLRLN